MILVTGATGHLGSAVIAQLSKITDKSNFAALARDEEKAKALKNQGIEVRIGDFDQPETLASAFAGVSKLLLISTIAPNRGDQHKAVIDAAKKAGVQHIAYTGVSLENLATSAVNFLMASHFETEDHIKTSGLSYTLFRNTLYADVIPGFVGPGVFENGIFLPTGTGKVPYALRREMGEAIATSLVSDDLNKTYDITGSELKSYADVADILSELSGKNVAYTDADADQFKQVLTDAGVDAFSIDFALGFATDVKNHQYESISPDLENLLRRKPATLKEALKEIYNL